MPVLNKYVRAVEGIRRDCSGHLVVGGVCQVRRRAVADAAACEPDGVEAALARFGKWHPLGRIGNGVDHVNVVVFLASTYAWMAAPPTNTDG
jgi:hypothetical protein